MLCSDTNLIHYYITPGGVSVRCFRAVVALFPRLCGLALGCWFLPVFLTDMLTSHVVVIFLLWC